MEYVAYLLIGFGLGYLSIKRFSKSSKTKLDIMKHDLEVRKEWLRMLSEQKNNKSNWPKGWN